MLSAESGFEEWDKKWSKVICTKQNKLSDYLDWKLLNEMKWNRMKARMFVETLLYPFNKYVIVNGSLYSLDGMS